MLRDAIPDQICIFCIFCLFRSTHSIFNKVVSVSVTCIDYDWTSDKKCRLVRDGITIFRRLFGAHFPAGSNIYAFCMSDTQQFKPK